MKASIRVSALTASIVASALLWGPRISAASSPDPPAFSTVHYDLDVSIDYDDERLRGIARISIRNHSKASAHRASFLLYRLMYVQRVVTESGEPLSFEQHVTSFDDFAKLQVNHIAVELGTAVEAGDTVTVEIEYGGHLLGYAETGMAYIRDHIDPEFTILRDDAFAFPVPGYPSIEAIRSVDLPSYDYVAHINVPDTLVVANGGHLTRLRTEEGRSTYEFRSIKKSWRMDFAIASYGTIESGPISVFHLPGDASGGAFVAAAATEAVELVQDRLGRRKEQGHLTFIEIPDGWGSQTDVTTIIQTAAAFRDTMRIGEVYHEITHLWGLEELERPPARWQEGLAEFMEYYLLEVVTGRPSLDDRANKLLQWLRSGVQTHPKWATTPPIEYGREQLTDLSYSVGALLFHVLFRVAGAERFFSFYRDFYSRSVETGATANDLARAAAQTLPGRIDGLFEDWMLSARWVDVLQDAESIDDLVERYR